MVATASRNAGVAPTSSIVFAVESGHMAGIITSIAPNKGIKKIAQRSILIIIPIIMPTIIATNIGHELLIICIVVNAAIPPIKMLAIKSPKRKYIRLSISP